jgi:hypothetical protein
VFVSLGDRRANLVSTAIPAARCIFCYEILSQVMTALHTLGLCAALVFSVLLLTGAGALVLRILRATDASSADTFLFSAALGIVLFDLAVIMGEFAPNPRVGIRLAAAIVGLVGLGGIRTVLSTLAQVARKILAAPQIHQLLAAVLLVVLALQGLAAIAPITGSDALHYHFTAEALLLAEGFHANWSLLHSFFCGLSHQLILAGLALGSDAIAQGWLFFGGALGALATLRLTQLWLDGVWPWLAALAFALTPVVFWQTTAAGAPDIWMSAFVPLCVLAILKARGVLSPSLIIVAGIFAGATAGTKYTGLIFATALLFGFLVAIHSAAKAALFFTAAVVVGIFPYVRNWFWAGDPVFPFLFARTHYSGVDTNQTAIHAILLDTGASHTFSALELLKFPLFAAVDGSHLGAWQLLGPLVLVFAPFAFSELRKSIEGRLALTVWILSALGIGLTSAMSRFLLPLLPVALAGSIAGVLLFSRERWRVLRALSVLSIAGFVFFGFAAMVVYSHSAWSVVAGRTAPESYLVAHSPDYERSQFVNREIERLREPGRTLIFFRHLYYVRVPFFNGDPEDSWEMNPVLLTSSAAWRDLFAKHQIRWVLKSPEYPASLVDSLTRLENDGLLRVCAFGEVESFAGNRIEGKRVREPITLYCIQNAQSTH